MKQFALSLLVLTLCGLVKAQTLDRISVSSGGITNGSLAAVIGEAIVFKLSDGAVSVSSGSLSDTSNTSLYSSTTIDTSTSIESMDVSEISIYPVPVDQWLIVESSDHSSLVVRILSTNGSVAFERTVRSGSPFDISHLSSGGYVLFVGNEAGRILNTSQIVKP